MTNDEYLKELASRGDGSLQAWFDSEHVDNARSAKRALAVERLKKLQGVSPIFNADIGAAIADGAPLSDVIELLTDDDGLRSNDGVAAEHVDANDDLAPESDVTADAVDANDENVTCNNSGDFVTDDSREKLEDDVCNWIHERRNHYAGNIGAIHQIYEWLNRQAEITRKTEQAAWIQQANGLIHQANVRGDELQAKVDELRDELAKRDKGIERLKRQRDTARAKIDELHAECDTCCYKTDYIEMDFCDVDRLEAERDALADDLLTCNRERERLRQALGIAIDHAHEVVSLVNLDGEVIG